MNKFLTIGRLTRDPETTSTVTKFSIAVDRKYKKEGHPTADFFNCVAFGKTGEFVDKYFEKGKRIGLVGRIQNDKWEDKDGNKRTSVSVIAEEVEFVESKEAKPQNKKQEEFAVVKDDDDDELPF